MAKNALVQDDLAKQVEPIESTEDSVVALLLVIADRVETASKGGGNAGLLNEYVKGLRDGSDEVTSAVLANLPARSKK